MQEKDENNHFRATLHTESQIYNYTFGMLNLIQICSVLFVCLCIMLHVYYI